MKIYAIRIGEWVEIRRALKRPTSIKTEAVQEVEEEVPDWEGIRRDFYGRMHYKKVKKDLKFMQVVHEGGEVIGVFKVRNFAALTGLSTKKNQVTLVPTKFHETLEEACKSM
jgi:hypothetical protein